MALALNPSAYETVRAIAFARALDEYVAHHGLAPHTLRGLARALSVTQAAARAGFFAWLWNDLDLPQYEPSPTDVEVIADEETLLGAWRLLGKPAPFPAFVRGILRRANPVEPGFDSSLVPLVVRDQYVGHAAAAGARGTDYSCETCRADQADRLMVRAQEAERLVRLPRDRRVH
jgi:hypothetical protein